MCGGKENQLGWKTNSLAPSKHISHLSLVSGDGAPLVNWVTNNIDNSAEGLSTDGDHDGGASIHDLLSTDQTLGTVHSNGTDSVLSQVLGNLKHKLGLAVCHTKNN